MSKEKTGLRFVVVGSSQFDDKSFVFGTLDALKNMYDSTDNQIETLYSSNFTGVSAFVQEWAQLNKIDFETHHFFSNNKVKTNPFFEQTQLPQAVVANDKFYQEGKDFLMSQKIDMVITMPNKDGKLGVQTENILRMATLASASLDDLRVMNAQELYAQILQARDDILNAKPVQNVQNGQKPRDNKVTNLGNMGKF